jgi:hypothetical protein
VKQKDFATIAITVFVAGIFSYIVCSKVIFASQDRQQKVEIVAPISADFDLPDKKIFNTDAINPTKLIEIGPNSNNQPFTNQ